MCCVYHGLTWSIAGSGVASRSGGPGSTAARRPSDASSPAAVVCVQLNRATDIGLRIVMHTAALDGLVKIDDLARTLAVPRHHLAKVVHRLQRLGVLQTTRGRGGGVRLAPGAVDRRVGGLVRELEGAGDVVDCERSDGCPLRGDCTLPVALRKAQEAFYASLDQLRIADLVGPSGPGLPPAPVVSAPAG